MTKGEFARKVLMGLGAPVTLHNRRALAAQGQTEGAGGKNNMFNTTQTMPRSTRFNSAGVQNYATGQEGVQATVKTLRYKGHGYEKIVKALKDNLPATVTIAAIGESDWGTDYTLLAAVLDDIKHDRHPNTLAELEARELSS